MPIAMPSSPLTKFIFLFSFFLVVGKFHDEKRSPVFRNWKKSGKGIVRIRMYVIQECINRVGTFSVRARTKGKVTKITGRNGTIHRDEISALVCLPSPSRMDHLSSFAARFFPRRRSNERFFPGSRQVFSPYFLLDSLLFENSLFFKIISPNGIETGDKRSRIEISRPWRGEKRMESFRKFLKYPTKVGDNEALKLCRWSYPAAIYSWSTVASRSRP